MSARVRVGVFVAVTVVAATAATAYAVRDAQRYQETFGASPRAEQTGAADLGAGPRIVFRHTGLDDRYGVVAMVSLRDADGPRAFTDLVCDRVDATPAGGSCLRTVRGVVTTFESDRLTPELTVAGTDPLPGIPSRTRLSDDGTLVATTSFVSGHDYLSTGFSTATEVHEVDGADHGNLERFDLVLDGRTVDPVDRNVWGVSFVDATSFFATVGTGGRTWLVEGDLTERTLRSVTENAECPAVSPDGTRVAFKVDVERGGAKEWQLAVMDLTTGDRTLLEGSHRGLDDQVEWLDDETLLYGLPRTEEPGITDVWALEVHADARPELLIEEAWSPSVVRGSGG